MNWIPIDIAPRSRKPFEMFVVIAMNVKPLPSSAPYTSDPYCVWREADGSFARWPHPFAPTHWCPLPRPADHTHTQTTNGNCQKSGCYHATRLQAHRDENQRNISFGHKSIQRQGNGDYAPRSGNGLGGQDKQG
jgi:hypothetical protein